MMGQLFNAKNRGAALTRNAWHSPPYMRLKLQNDTVAFLSEKLAAALGKTPLFCANLKLAAGFRDAGKQLMKEQDLVAPNNGMSQQHALSKRITAESRLARRFLNNESDPVLRMASDVAAFYRERWDGKGFPGGLVAHEIPAAARIVAICVTHQALTMKTRHGAEMPGNDALTYISSQAGHRFDPTMVRVFLEMQAELCRDTSQPGTD